MLRSLITDGAYRPDDEDEVVLSDVSSGGNKDLNSNESQPIPDVPLPYNSNGDIQRSSSNSENETYIDPGGNEPDKRDSKTDGEDETLPSVGYFSLVSLTQAFTENIQNAIC
jgi:hypothetical protein